MNATDMSHAADTVDRDLFPSIHPGEILKEEFLDPLGISVYRLAHDIGVDAGRIHDIIRGKRAVTADTAARLALFFGTSVQFWLNLQASYEADEARAHIEKVRAQVVVSPEARRKLDRAIAEGRDRLASQNTDALIPA